ncbi:hypothetical protein [Lentzea flava]|uniref:Uncharacterized protein n=1 Tax=Lentzea flava TaxID=103732 RepID=A0ABQ2UMR0_9PSEU|nr:hypothetical protein GCM10010178_39570 [Lentzea flava]
MAVQFCRAAELVEVLGVLARRLLQRRIWQATGLFAKLGDLPGQVQPFRADEHLHWCGERMQIPPETGYQSLLLRRRAEPEVDRGAHRDHRDAVIAEIDDAGIGDRLGWQPQRGRRHHRC